MPRGDDGWTKEKWRPFSFGGEGDDALDKGKEACTRQTGLMGWSVPCGERRPEGKRNSLDGCA